MLACCTKAEKLSNEAAEGEYIKCCYNLSTNLQNLEIKKKKERRQKTAAYEKWVLSQPMDEPTRVPRKDIEIFNRWLATFARFLFRYKFFVATGPSLSGKSLFLKMSMPGNAFICTCKDAVEPDLREFVGPPYFENILYDEAGPDMVQSHRDLFQSPRHKVGLGHSGTNCYAYEVFVYKVRMAIATNDWWGEMQKLEPEAVDWLNSKSQVLTVDQLLFTEALLNSSGAHQAVAS